MLSAKNDTLLERKQRLARRVMCCIKEGFDGVLTKPAGEGHYAKSMTLEQIAPELTASQLGRTLQ